MNRILISFLFLLTITKAFPDTYTLYLIESKDSTILEETETDILSLLKTPGITIVSFIQTEGVTSPEDPGTVRTYAIPFTATKTFRSAVMLSPEKNSNKTNAQGSCKNQFCA